MADYPPGTFHEDLHGPDWVGGKDKDGVIAELLAALEYVMSAHGEQLHDAFDQARAAIAKATGAAPSNPEEPSIDESQVW
jgi:hypothetical protein